MGPQLLAFSSLCWLEFMSEQSYCSTTDHWPCKLILGEGPLSFPPPELLHSILPQRPWPLAQGGTIFTGGLVSSAAPVLPASFWISHIRGLKISGKKGKRKKCVRGYTSADQQVRL